MDFPALSETLILRSNVLKTKTKLSKICPIASWVPDKIPQSFPKTERKWELNLLSFYVTLIQISTLHVKSFTSFILIGRWEVVTWLEMKEMSYSYFLLRDIELTPFSKRKFYYREFRLCILVFLFLTNKKRGLIST